MPPTSFLAKRYSTANFSLFRLSQAKPTKRTKRYCILDALLRARRYRSRPVSVSVSALFCVCSLLYTLHKTEQAPPRQFKLAPSGTIYISILHVPPSPLFASQLSSLSSLFSFFFSFFFLSTHHQRHHRRLLSPLSHTSSPAGNSAVSSTITV